MHRLGESILRITSPRQYTVASPSSPSDTSRLVPLPWTGGDCALVYHGPGESTAATSPLARKHNRLPQSIRPILSANSPSPHPSPSLYNPPTPTSPHYPLHSNPGSHPTPVYRLGEAHTQLRLGEIPITWTNSTPHPISTLCTQPSISPISAHHHTLKTYQNNQPHRGDRGPLTRRHPSGTALPAHHHHVHDPPHHPRDGPAQPP